MTRHAPAGFAATRPHAAPLGWRTHGLTYRYRSTAEPALDRVSIEVPAVACTAILGPNGSGKSTLLRLLLGTAQPAEGAVEFGGRPLGDWKRRTLAQTVGVVPQHEEIAFPITVRELVEMGRYPHLGLLGREGVRDSRAVQEAMERCDIAPLADRLFTTLSGGERQRARLARAFAQEPSVLALDEPTAALDVRHEMEIFQLLTSFTRSGGTVIVVTHNINLAARFAHRLTLLARGRVIAAGTADEVLRADALEAVYEWPVQVSRFPGPGPDRGALQVTPLLTRESGNLQDTSSEGTEG